MEHKAFIFDTPKFNQELRSIILTSGVKDDPKRLKKFINTHLDQLTSPYTEEPLDADWEDELENEDVQEYADFALTYCYNLEEEIGLAYAWDALIGISENLDTDFDPEYVVLGEALEDDDFVLDPGQEGMGFVEAEDINEIYDELVELKESFTDAVKKISLSEDTLYEISETELLEGYQQLLTIYKTAKERNLGLMMTF